MTNLKKTSVDAAGKESQGASCDCGTCTCGCPTDNCACRENNCQCGCRTPVSGK